MAVWVELYDSAEQLATLAKDRSVYIQQESQFILNQQQNSDRFIRLGFAGLSCEKIENGLACLFNHKIS